MLYARTRGMAVWAVTLAGTALVAWWCAEWLIDTSRFGGAAGRVPVVSMAPLLAAAAVVGSLHVHGREIEETAARRQWLWRAGQIVLGTAVSAAVLAATVLLDAAQFGAVAMARNVIGCVGLAALASVLLGARLSWLPLMLYATTVYLSAPRQAQGATIAWAWPTQPGPEPAAWAAAIALFLVGSAACSWLGPRAPLGDE
ncbi:MAG: hypothetical protein ACRDP3_09840 [Streptomyces sp.]|uniref:hypothetical protein n=1 Tax=Streptomyces sp. TaxID=1931 RepID=UPI003D6A5D74